MWGIYHRAGLHFFFFGCTAASSIRRKRQKDRWQSGGGRGSWLTVGPCCVRYISTQRLKADPTVHVAQGRTLKFLGSREMIPGSLHAHWTPGKPAVILLR